MTAAAAVAAAAAEAMVTVTDDVKATVMFRVELSRKAGCGKSVGYSLEDADWTESEIALVAEGLKRFPPRAVSNVTLYVQIAAILPRKSVRDVAARIHAMQEASRPAPKPQLPRKRPRPTSVAEVAEAVAGASGPLKRAAHQGAAAAAAAARLGQGPPRRMRPSNPAVEVNIAALLADNTALIVRMRDNYMMGRYQDNYQNIVGLNDNFGNVAKLLAALPVRLPPLPVQVDPYYFARATGSEIQPPGPPVGPRFSNGGGGGGGSDVKAGPPAASAMAAAAAAATAAVTAAVHGQGGGASRQG